MGNTKSNFDAMQDVVDAIEGTNIDITQRDAVLIQNMVTSNIHSNRKSNTFVVNCLFEDGEIVTMYGKFKENVFTDAYIKYPTFSIKKLSKYDFNVLYSKYF